VVVDVDATLVTSHSEKENATPTFRKGFGFHPLCAFVDHGAAGTGEPLAIALRPGNAGSNTAADHIAVIGSALRQLPGCRRGKSVLVRIDGAGSTHKVIDWLTRRRLSYSVGFTLPDNTPDLLRRIPEHVWTEAYDAHDGVRDGAWVAELTHLMDLSAWPAGMRVIVRKERPHPGAQLRFEDVDGMRITAFATNTTRGQLPDLELRHRRRAKCEDRIRTAKDTGLNNLPLASFAANQIWCAVVALAAEITAWMQLLAFTNTDTARRWEPKKLRYRIFTIPATLARSGRRIWLHLPTLGRTDPDRAATAGRPGPLLSRAPPFPRPRPTPGPGTGAHPGRHRDLLSHPDGKITPGRQQNCPTPSATAHRERSRLGVTKMISDPARQDAIDTHEGAGQANNPTPQRATVSGVLESSPMSTRIRLP